MKNSSIRSDGTKTFQAKGIKRFAQKAMWPDVGLKSSPKLPKKGTAVRFIKKNIFFKVAKNLPNDLVDPCLTEKRVDRKKNDGWPKFFFYQKQYVLYGITATSELVYLFLRRVDRMENFFFRSIVNFHFGLTEKIFNLQLTERIIDRKFPTFYVPIYHYKTYITHCYAIYFQELPWKSSPSCPRF